MIISLGVVFLYTIVCFYIFYIDILFFIYYDDFVYTILLYYAIMV
jgi:hypothetical protein